jgi:membrane fusion protein, copper/silver efflux system
MNYCTFIALVVVAVLFTNQTSAQNHTSLNNKSEHQKNHTAHSELWTCAMHPQIKRSRPGKCPICNMDLVLAHSPSLSDTPRTKGYTLSEEAMRLADIATTPVVRKAVKKEIRLIGTIDFDETRLAHITARVPGRIEQMFVDYTGIRVEKGEHMFKLYSPTLLTAQEELIQAARSVARLSSSGSTLLNSSTKRSLNAAREKLSLLGLTEKQVAAVEKKREAIDYVTIYAPLSGVVVERNAVEGAYVETGTRIYSIADLSNLWVKLQAYESDLPWLRFGQKVKFTTKALPGRVFTGIISFISPTVDKSTRTTRVRVAIDNSDGLLKPGLFVTGAVKAEVYQAGKILDASLAGKYISPMHPQFIADEPGSCPICGMDLVPAEELGYVTDSETLEKPLVVPDTAPLLTGTRSVVYVKNPNAPTFDLREVTLGPHAENFYIVEKGLAEGELVVTRGAFKLDADLQIRGEPSMMTPQPTVMQTK